MDKYVTLTRSPSTSGDTDGFFEDLTPKHVWAQVQTLPPQDDGKVRGALVTIRHHPTITIETCVTYVDRDGNVREWFVKGIQRVDEQGAEMRLYCEEVEP